MTVTILGVKYKIIYEELSSDRDGYCNCIKKEIHVDPRGSKAYVRDVLRHEIMHVFFYESGIEKYFRDEELCSWLAIQFDKLVKVIQEVEK